MENKDRIIIDLKPEFIGKIDLLVDKGLYISRTDFIEKSILSQLSAHTSTIEEYQKKHNTVIGIVNYSRKELENIIKEGKKLHIRVIGALRFDKDVTPELAHQAINEINLAGIFRANKDVKRRLAPKRYTLLGNPYRFDQEQLEGDTEEDNDDIGAIAFCLNIFQ